MEIVIVNLSKNYYIIAPIQDANHIICFNTRWAHANIAFRGVEDREFYVALELRSEGHNAGLQVFETRRTILRNRKKGDLLGLNAGKEFLSVGLEKVWTVSET